MILDVQGMFAGKWLKLTYKISKEILENRLEDDKLFGYDSVEDYKYNNNFENNLTLLKRYPDDIEIVSGGRLDIIARTPVETLYELSDYRLEKDNLTLLERLIEVLKEVEQYPLIEEYTQMHVSIQNVGDAISILNARDI